MSGVIYIRSLLLLFTLLIPALAETSDRYAMILRDPPLTRSLRSRQEVGDHIGLAGSLEALAKLVAATRGLPAGFLGWRTARAPWWSPWSRRGGC